MQVNKNKNIVHFRVYLESKCKRLILLLLKLPNSNRFKSFNNKSFSSDIVIQKW